MVWGCATADVGRSEARRMTGGRLQKGMAITAKGRSETKRRTWKGTEVRRQIIAARPGGDEGRAGEGGKQERVVRIGGRKEAEGAKKSGQGIG
jgi:hypothetical protein